MKPKPIAVGALVRHTWRGNGAIVYRVTDVRDVGRGTRYRLVPVLDPCGQPVTRHHGYRPVWCARPTIEQVTLPTPPALGAE